MKCIQLQWIGNIGQSFSYRGTSCCFLHDESFRKKNLWKRFRHEPFYNRYLWHYYNRTKQFWKTHLQIILRLLNFIFVFIEDIFTKIYRRSGIINSIENLKNYKYHETANYRTNHNRETIDFLEHINFHGLQDMFDK